MIMLNNNYNIYKRKSKRKAKQMNGLLMRWVKIRRTQLRPIFAKAGSSGESRRLISVHTWSSLESLLEAGTGAEAVETVLISASDVCTGAAGNEPIGGGGAGVGKSGGGGRGRALRGEATRDWRVSWEQIANSATVS